MMTTRSRCLNWETMWQRSIAESSNTATVKKNQNHGSRSRCAKSWVGSSDPPDATVSTDRISPRQQPDS